MVLLMTTLLTAMPTITIVIMALTIASCRKHSYHGSHHHHHDHSIVGIIVVVITTNTIV